MSIVNIKLSPTNATQVKRRRYYGRVLEQQSCNQVLIMMEGSNPLTSVLRSLTTRQ